MCDQCKDRVETKQKWVEDEIFTEYFHLFLFDGEKKSGAALVYARKNNTEK